MTVEKAIAILKNERECVMTASANNCNRECLTCPLVKETYEILSAYNFIINRLESEATDNVDRND